MGKATDEHFGGCPQCGTSTGVLSIGRDHWFYCDEHRTKWWVGSNLFSSWREMTEAEFDANREHLKDFTKV
jgi:hypothetical protein